MWVKASECGGRVSETDLAKSEAYIRKITRGRADGEDPCVLAAVRAVAELFALERERGIAQSESNDGYSVAYEGGADISKRIYETAAIYLDRSLLCAAV